MSTAAALAHRRAAAAGRLRDVVTPEGIPIRFELASAADRAAAFILDVMFQIVGLAVVLVAVSLASGGGGSILGALAIVLVFLVLNFYFALFELRWQGATPGKRIVGLRVIDARGGQLENSAVLARNFVRELEVWMPLRFLFGAPVVWPGAPGWALVLAGLWTAVFLFLPLCNRDRLRVGDLIAGTRVVMRPRTVLVPDLADESVGAAAPGAAHAFTAQQLGVYGIYELQVLEGLLREHPGAHGFAEAVAAVTERIRAKLGYEGEIRDGERFLRDFYAALRRHLEQRLLFGQRREDKHAR